MPRRTFTYAEGLGLETYNLISTIGAFIFTLAFVPLLWNLWRTWRRGEPAGANPWDASTLEWTMSSPPPHYNFAVIPKVESRDPLWHPYVEPGRPYDSEPGGVIPRLQPDPAPEHVHMPDPSYWPLVMATGMLVITVGALIGLSVVIPGVILTFIGLYGWAFEPIEH